MGEKEFKLPAYSTLMAKTKEELVEDLIKQIIENMRYNDEFIDKKKLSKRWGVSIGTINNLMKHNKLPEYRPLEDKERSRVSFPLSRIVEMENKGIKYSHAKE